MTGCESIRELAQGCLDGILASEENERLARHLRGCPACRQVMATYRRLYSALAAPAIPAAPPWLVAATLARVEAARRRRRFFQTLVMAAGLLVAAGSACLLAWGGLPEALPAAADAAGSMASWRAATDSAVGLATSLASAAGEAAGWASLGQPATALVLVALAFQVLLAYRWRGLARAGSRHSTGGAQ